MYTRICKPQRPSNAVICGLRLKIIPLLAAIGYWPLVFLWHVPYTRRRPYKHTNNLFHCFSSILIVPIWLSSNTLRLICNNYQTISKVTICPKFITPLFHLKIICGRNYFVTLKKYNLLLSWGIKLKFKFKYIWYSKFKIQN